MALFDVVDGPLPVRLLGSLTGGRAAFRRRLAAYFASAPAVRVRGVTKYVQLDSVVRVRGLLSDSYQVGYFLTDRPAPRDFEATAARGPALRSSEDEAGILYVGGFESLEGFSRARERFEATAELRYRTMALGETRPEPARQPLPVPARGLEPMPVATGPGRRGV